METTYNEEGNYILYCLNREVKEGIGKKYNTWFTSFLFHFILGSQMMNEKEDEE